ncbi:MAG: hypothetical protein OXL37_15460 [Chloroflexota bacterium]|nr:hypothetical protein [Chloroflexota bacterium]MDE2961889.1 hypothetical protein [Chloroflexota bacterium]
MAESPNLSPRQVSDAIRVGLSNRRDVDLPDSEAAEASVTYRDNLIHYREHVLKSLDAGDYRQVAEKSWGAYSQTVKAIAADRSLRVRSHTSILRVSEQLVALVSSADPVSGSLLDNGVNSAHSLHIHFYENDLPDETVTRRADAVAAAIDLLQELFPADTPAP